MQSLILCRKDKWREESDARGNVSGRGGVWPRGELRRIVKRRNNIKRGNPIDQCRKDEWEEGNDARGSVPGE